jgi:hypothetical protein
MIQNRHLNIFLPVLSFVSVLFPLVVEAKDDVKVIAVKEIVVRAAPGFLSKPVFKMQYGDRVEVLGEREIWIRIAENNKSGWIPKSAIQDGFFIQREIGRGKATSDSIYRNEIVTAGKGFSPEYEKMLKESDGKLNYDFVNDLGKREVDEVKLSRFSIDAGLESNVFRAKK